MGPQMGRPSDQWWPVTIRLHLAIGRMMSWLPPKFLVRLLASIGRGGRNATAAEVEEARGAVCSASVRAAGNGCLQRSIATYLLCRRRGATPVWKSGFRTDPFVAHAWVEAEGVPVGEPEAVSAFTAVLSTANEMGSR